MYDRKKYYLAYRNKHRQRLIQSQIDYRVQHPERQILRSTKHQAKKIGVEFNLTIEDIVIPEYCPYMGVKITYIYGNGKQQYNPSIDRIDPTKGYIKGNVQMISYLANRMKQDATIEQLVVFAQNVLRMHS